MGPVYLPRYCYNTAFQHWILYPSQSTLDMFNVGFLNPQHNDFNVYSSTQHPSETQQIIAKMLNQKNNTINVEVRRIGGGFGGKETQSFIFSEICPSPESYYIF